MEITKEIVAQHNDQVRAIADNLCDGDYSFKEDLVQDAWVKIIEDAATFEGKAAFATWMHRVARNAMLNSVKKHKDPTLSYAPNEDLAEMSHEQGEEYPDPAAVYKGEQTVINLMNCVSNMEPTMQRVVRLTIMDDVTRDNAADLIGIEPREVKTLKAKAMLLLREHVEAL